MLAIVHKKDGTSIEFDGIKNTYVQNGKLIVLEFYPPATHKELPIINKKYPIEDVDNVEEVDGSWVDTRRKLESETVKTN